MRVAKEEVVDFFQSEIYSLVDDLEARLAGLAASVHAIGTVGSNGSDLLTVRLEENFNDVLQQFEKVRHAASPDSDF